jgi:hypothetical protein
VWDSPRANMSERWRLQKTVASLPSRRSRRCRPTKPKNCRKCWNGTRARTLRGWRCFWLMNETALTVRCGRRFGRSHVRPATRCAHLPDFDHNHKSEWMGQFALSIVSRRLGVLVFPHRIASHRRIRKTSAPFLLLFTHPLCHIHCATRSSCGASS